MCGKNRVDGEQPNFPLPPSLGLLLPPSPSLSSMTQTLSLSVPFKSALKRVPNVNDLHLGIKCLTVGRNNGFHSVSPYSVSGPCTRGTLHTSAHFTPLQDPCGAQLRSAEAAEGHGLPSQKLRSAATTGSPLHSASKPRSSPWALEALPPRPHG